MLKRLKLTPALVIAFFLLCSCSLFDDPETEEEKLPKATQSGKNTFGCLVDGKAWVTETSIDARAFYQEGVFLVTALFNDSRNGGVSIYIYDINLIGGEYFLSNRPNQFENQFATFSNASNDCVYETSSVHTGTLNITHLDQISYIVSGNFEFEAYSDDCDEIVKIRKGRFDLTYAP